MAYPGRHRAPLHELVEQLSLDPSKLGVGNVLWHCLPSQERNGALCEAGDRAAKSHILESTFHAFKNACAFENALAKWDG